MKRKDNKAARLVLAVIFFFGTLVCLLWSGVTFVVFLQTLLGHVFFVAFLTSAILFMWEGILRVKKPRKRGKVRISLALAEFLLGGFFLFFTMREIISDPSFETLVAVTLMFMLPIFLSFGAGMSRIRNLKRTTSLQRGAMMKKKGFGRVRTALGLSEIMVFGPLCILVPAYIFWNRPPSTAVAMAVILFFVCALFVWAGIGNIRGERTEPEKEQPGDSGRAWWPIRLFMFISPVLYGVSATVIQRRPSVKKTGRSGHLSTLRLFYEILAERISRSRPHNLGKALTFVKVMRIVGVMGIVITIIVGGIFAFALVVYIDPGTLASAIMLAIGLSLAGLFSYRRRSRRKEYGQVQAMLSG